MEESADISSTVAKPEKQAIKIEVYTFPSDCTVDDFLYQFERKPYNAKCLGHRKKSSSYILEYPTEEAERILAQPEQLLDEDDEESKIQIRRLELPRTILLSNAASINDRLLKKYFKDNYGAVESCEKYQHDSCQRVITFNDSSVMEAFKLPQKLVIGRHEIEARLLEMSEDEEEDCQSFLQSDDIPEGGRDNIKGSLAGDTMELLRTPGMAPPGPAGDMTYENLDMTESELSTTASSAEGHPSPCGARKVLVETGMSDVVFKKFIRSKSKGTLARTLSTGKYVLEYGTDQEAKEVVDRKTVEWGGNTMTATYYLSEDDSDEYSTESETNPMPEATFVEVKMPQYEVSAQDLYLLLRLHFDEVFECEDGEYTSFEIAWDEDMQLFRFDLPVSRISLLTESPQSLLIDANEVLLDITACHADRNVIVRPAPHMTKHLSKAQLKASMGATSQFQAEMNIVKFSQDEAELEFSSHSFAARLACKQKLRLRNGLEVKVQFLTELAESESESISDGSLEEEHVNTDDADVRTAPVPAPRLSQTLYVHTTGQQSNTQTTLLVGNLVDVDEETLYFWIKSLLDAWPISIQLSADGEDAVVKMPSSCNTGNIHHALCEEFQLQGETLRVSQIEPTTCIQVICQSTAPGGTIEEDTLEAYFSHRRFTGLEQPTALKAVKPKGFCKDLPVYILTYSSSFDVEQVISRRPHKHGQWSFDVAEFYPDLDVCSPENLWTCSDSPARQSDGLLSSPQPVLHIIDIDEEINLETLELFMSHRKRSDGGEISSWQEKRSQDGRHSVQVIYKDLSVAERVYKAHHSRPLTFSGKTLQLELELPWFTASHDQTKIRVSELGSDMDVEKLRFYLSAISGNIVTEILFNDIQTRAVASFGQPLDYWRLICSQRSTPLNDCPNMKLAQEYKATSLVATGDLRKEDIELVLETVLLRKYDREIDVHAEELPGTTDMWRIATEHEAMCYILTLTEGIPRWKSVSLYSDFLGIHVTHGACKKSEQLSNLITDSLTLRFLTNVPSGHDKLVKFIHSLGLTLTEDGLITLNASSSQQEGRTSLKNWRKLRHHMDKFVQDELTFHRVDKLTQQVYEKLTAQIRQIVSGLPVITGANRGVDKSTNAIAVVGAKEVVEPLKIKLARAVEQIESEIEVERTVKEVFIPNILDYQINYLKLIDFFDAKRSEYQLVSFTSDIPAQCIMIKAIPRNVEAVQREMLHLLPQISLSKVTMNRKPIFWKVFTTESASQAIQQQLAAKKIKAVWNLANKTLSVYSESKAISQSALDCISDTIWEEQFPASGPLDDLEKQLLSSDLWTKKKAELQQLYQPLELMEIEGNTKLWMAGLTHSKAIVQEVVPFFFTDNVQRTSVFTGTPDKVLFLNRFSADMLKDLEHENHVKLAKKDADTAIEITGTKDNIATCGRRLKEFHDSVVKDMYIVEHQAMIMFINENHDFLDSVGFRMKCVISLHKEDALVEAAVSVLGSSMSSSSSRYSVTLPNGTMCEVKRANIVTMACDAIVNASNGDLKHIGGLALAIVQKGGYTIQQECTDFIRRQGALFEGQVFTSGSGNLNCKKIIHAVGPRWKDGHSQEERTLYSCIDNCFDETEKHKLQSVAIPPISTGIFGYPLDQAVKTIVEALHDRQQRGGYLPQRIVFVDNKDNSLRMFEDELKKVYGRQVLPAPSPQEAFRPAGTSSAKITKSKYTINGNTIRALNKLNIEIKHGDLATAEEDTLVNSVGEKLDLTAGKVAQAIAAQAGPELQTACSRLSPMKTGEIKETDGFRLKCKKVLHVFCHQWKGSPSAQELKKLVTGCMMKAAANGHQSVAFPALGTGTLSYPKDEVARVMIEALIEYAERHNSSIGQVKIYIYHRDEPTKKSFANELQRLSNVRAPQPATARASPQKIPKRNLNPILESVQRDAASRHQRPQQQTASGGACGVKVHNTEIRVLQGDISQHSAGALVNCTDSRLGTGGKVSRALLSKAGDVVQDEVYALSFTASNKGLWMSSAGELPAKYIFHIDTQSAKRAHDGWQKIISRCLKTCDEQRLTSIAFPALGTGQLDVPSSQMAEIMLQSLVTYIDRHSKTTVRRIDIVLIQQEMVGDFVSSIKKANEKKQHWWTRLKVGVSELSFFILGDGIVEGIPEPQSHSHFTPNLGDVDNLELRLDIYGNTEEDIRRCKADLEKKLDNEMYTVVWANKESYKKDRQYIPKLTTSQHEKLRNSASRLGVKLEISKQLSNIKVVGLPRKVSEMCDLVSSELHKLEMDAHEQREAVFVAKTVQWEYEDGSGSWATFHPSINKDLEQTYQENPNGRFKYQSSFGEVSLELSRMSGIDDSRIPFKIQRTDLTIMPGTPSVAFPSRWQAPHDIYQEFPLTPATAEYNEVKKNFMKTLGAGGNNVLEIRRVQNPSRYQHYMLMRKDVATNLKRTEDKVEQILWHGTNEDAVTKIASTKFDRGLAGENAAMYGTGCYFATTSAYSARFSKANQNGQKYMIQTRVVTGEWCQGKQQFKTAPDKTNGNRYDSVVDDINKPTIFVVFDDNSAYPEYIIKFQ